MAKNSRARSLVSKLALITTAAAVCAYTVRERRRISFKSKVVLISGASRGLGLELVDMGTEEGGTYLIHPKMYEAIGSSEIFIADLTALRPNVMIELGYALHHQGTKRLLLMFNPIAGADKVPFDTNSFRYEQIGEAADIPSKLKGHLVEILNGAKAGTI